MNVIAMSQQVASAHSQRLLERLGKEAAQRMWDRILRSNQPASMVPELVEDECEVLQIMLKDGGATPSDIPIVIDFYRLVIVREGKRLAIPNAMVEGGTA